MTINRLLITAVVVEDRPVVAVAAEVRDAVALEEAARAVRRRLQSGDVVAAA